MIHADDDPVIFTYSASSNISFRGRLESGWTWGEWRELGSDEQDEAVVDFLFQHLGVDIGVEDDES